MSHNEQALTAARNAFQDMGCESPNRIEQGDYDYATASFIRAYISLRGLCALTELIVEQSDTRLQKLFALIAESIEWQEKENHEALGEYLAEIVNDYLADTIESVAADLPPMSE